MVRTCRGRKGDDGGHGFLGASAADLMSDGERAERK